MREDVSLQRLTEKVMMRHTGVRNGEIEKATANKENNKNSNSNKRYSDEQHLCLSLSLSFGERQEGTSNMMIMIKRQVGSIPQHLLENGTVY